MNNPIGIYQGPNAPDPIPTNLTQPAMQKGIRDLNSWSINLTYSLNNYFTGIRTQLNSQVQALPSVIPSASTIAVSLPLHYISGTATIETITPPGGFSGPIWLIATGAFSLGASGNIALSQGPFTVGQAVNLVYDPGVGLWYPIGPIGTQPNITFGSWTPTLQAVGGNPTVNYAAQYGRYLTVNGFVFLTFYLPWNSFSGGGAGQVSIGGNPAINCSNWAEGYIGNQDGSTNNIGVQVVAGTSELSIVQVSTGGAIALTNWNGAGFSQMLGNVIYASA